MPMSLLIQLEACIELCLALKDCLKQERLYLIELRMEELAETTMLKDYQVQLLARKRKALTAQLLSRFGSADLSQVQTQLPEALAGQWEAKHREWLAAWSSTRDLCESNQVFLRHSLKNLGMVADNMKRLLGESPLYSSSGKRKESPTAGKVLEAKY